MSTPDIAIRLLISCTFAFISPRKPIYPEFGTIQSFKSIMVYILLQRDIIGSILSYRKRSRLHIIIYNIMIYNWSYIFFLFLLYMYAYCYIALKYIYCKINCAGGQSRARLDILNEDCGIVFFNTLNVKSRIAFHYRIGSNRFPLRNRLESLSITGLTKQREGIEMGKVYDVD